MRWWQHALLSYGSGFVATALLWAPQVIRGHFRLPGVLIATFFWPLGWLAVAGDMADAVIRRVGSALDKRGLL